HRPYSLNLSPIDFHLFLSPDNHIRNKQFNNKSNLKEASGFFYNQIIDFYKSGIYKLLYRLGESYKVFFACKYKTNSVSEYLTLPTISIVMNTLLTQYDYRQSQWFNSF
ncbi:hypothetical protein E2986_13632, partial [Frieseomelitta varia]